MSTNTITSKDGATIFYKDWGTGQPAVFSHGWPLTADAMWQPIYPQLVIKQEARV